MSRNAYGYMESILTNREFIMLLGVTESRSLGVRFVTQTRTPYLFSNVMAVQVAFHVN